MPPIILPSWNSDSPSTFHQILQKTSNITSTKGTITITPLLVSNVNGIKNIDKSVELDFIKTYWSERGPPITVDNTRIDGCKTLQNYYVVERNDVIGVNIYYLPLIISKGDHQQTVYVSLMNNNLYQYHDDKTNMLYNNVTTRNSAFQAARENYDVFVKFLKLCTSKNQSAGSKKSKYTRTNDPKVKTVKGWRCVYVGSRGAKYVKLGGVFVNIKKL